jgi:hypothetical protein
LSSIIDVRWEDVVSRQDDGAQVVIMVDQYESDIMVVEYASDLVGLHKDLGDEVYVISDNEDFRREARQGGADLALSARGLRHITQFIENQTAARA